MPIVGPAVEEVEARAYRIPTDAPEADGTISWIATSMVVVEVRAGGRSGLGYSYGAPAAAELVRDPLAEIVTGAGAFDIPALWDGMAAALRNIGRPGVASHALSAVDAALWDLKARLLDLPLVCLLGTRRRSVPIYGSGGFTSYGDARLEEQLSGWVAEEGCRAVKMKVGSEPERDCARVRRARRAVGEAALYVDANGAYTRKQALDFARAFAEEGVGWFEEPVSSDDLAGLRLLRDRAPAVMEVAAGEYGYTPYYFRQMLEAGAVDVLQADATRCGGVTGFLAAAALADAWMLPLSAHTAPSLHLHPACAAPRLRNVEWFHDHVRIEQALFDGAPSGREGAIAPDLSRPGHGLTFKRADAERYAV